MLRTLFRSTLLVALAAGALATAPAAAAAPAAPASAEAAPANDAFANATVLTGASGSITATNVGATKEPGEPNHANHPGGASVWFSWTAPATGNTRFDTCVTPGLFTLMHVYTGTAVNALTPVEEGPNACAPGARVDLPVVQGQNYKIAIDGIEVGEGVADQGGFTLTWTGPPANDAFAAAIPLAGTASGATNGTNVSASKEVGEPDHVGTVGGASVWYSWTAPANATVRFDTCTGTFDSVVALYTGSAVAALTPVAGRDDGCGLQSVVDAVVTAGTTYRIAVEGMEGGGQAAQGTFTLRWGPRPAHGPDAAIRLGTSGGTWVGRNVYDETGRTQSLRASVGAGGTARFTVQIRNRETVDRSFEVVGPDETATFRVSYFLPNGADVTLAVVEGAQLFLDPGASQRIIVALKPRGTAPSGATITAKIRVTELDPLPHGGDTVIARATKR